MKILIATGIYPPEIGGPAQYAYNLEKTFKKEGHTVWVKHFTQVERILPTGFRHAYYALKSMYAYVRADHTLVLDTFSVAWPIYMLSRIFGKSYIIRTGGDFLWESYVERTKKKVLFSEFYKTEVEYFNKKEQFIYKTTKKILARAKTIVFSTTWQRDIFIQAYGLDISRTTIIENYFDIEKRTVDVESGSTGGVASSGKVFITGSRDLVWKNKDTLLPLLTRLQKEFPEKNILVDNNRYEHADYIHAIKHAYAVVLVSLGDISPNMILDSIRCGKPFLLTQENGISDRIQGLGLFADPLDIEDVYSKLTSLLDPTVYQQLQTNIRNFTYTHTWDEMADEYVRLFS